MAILRRLRYGYRLLFKIGLVIGVIIYLGFFILQSQTPKQDGRWRQNLDNVLDYNTFNVTRAHISLANIPQRPYRRFDGTWKASSVSPRQHRHYEVNCSALVYGDRAVVKQTNDMLDVFRKNGSAVPMPSDADVKSWANDCKGLLEERAYPRLARSKEELEYPIAYILLVHKDAAQVERLLRAIYQPQNVYCLHPDAGSDPGFSSAIYGLANCFPNVFIPSRVERIQYRGISRLMADINCMRDLVQHPVSWRYVINLCGQDFPLKTNLEIVQQLKAFGGYNDIEAQVPPSYIASRTKVKFDFRPGYQKPISTGIQKEPPPHNMTIYFGNAYIAATRVFVEFVLFDREAVDLLEWLADTWSPDETFWATLQHHPRAPGRLPHGEVTKKTLVRMMRWGDIHEHPQCQGKYVRALCVFGVGYLDYLVSIPHLFANKFHYSYDPVNLQCLEELLDYRESFPRTVKEFVKGFPTLLLPWYFANVTKYR